MLLQKEGESFKDNTVQQARPGGKRVIGKAVAKGGLLLKGKNPGNVRLYLCATLPPYKYAPCCCRFNGKKTISERECLLRQTPSEKRSLTPKLCDKNTLTFSCRGFSEYAHHNFLFHRVVTLRNRH